MKFILGKKIEMSQAYDETGAVVPVTLVSAGPCVVVEVLTAEKTGYTAVKIGLGAAKRVNKPRAGELKELGKFQYLREFRVDDVSAFNRGDTVLASTFAKGDVVDVISKGKGRGFQGVVRRHGFAGSPASHGHKDQLRMPGSIGSKRIGPVQKGKRMAGHMGDAPVTVKNLKIVDIDAAKNLLYIKGAIPGARGGLIKIVSK